MTNDPNPEAHRIAVERLAPDVWLVALGGEHDLASVDELRTSLDRATEGGSSAVVDLSHTTFIDSSVAGLLIERAGARNGGPPAVALVVPQESFPFRVLRLLGIDEMLPLHETRDEAVRACVRAAPSESL